MHLPDATVAVTGATGFVGSHIIDALVDAGCSVRAVVRNPQKAEGLAERGVDIAKADILEPGDLVEAMRGCDVIVSNAALGSWSGELPDYERVNQLGATNVLQAASKVGIRRAVVISTVAVYRTRLYAAMDEQTVGHDTSRRRFNWSDLTTDWRYARTKTVGEAMAREHAESTGMGITFLRPSPVYGSRDPKVTQRYLDRLDRAVTVEPTVGVPFVHARDVADAVVASLANPDTIGRAYNLAGPPVSPFTLMRTLKRVAGRGPVVLPLPLPIWVRFDTSAAARDLGFAPRALDDGLRESLPST